jgi:hypothetical protein
MLLDNLFTHPKAQARAGRAFAGDEGLKNAAQQFSGNTLALVSDGYLDATNAAGATHWPRAQNDFSAVRHGIKGVSH